MELDKIDRKTKDVLAEALKDVKQELLIIDEKDVSHLVYIHNIKWSSRGLEVEFSTPEKDKEALSTLVHDAIYAQIKDSIPEPTVSLWGKFKEWAYTSKVGRFIQQVTYSYF